MTEPGGAEARLVASSGLGTETLSSGAAMVSLVGERAVWPLRYRLGEPGADRRRRPRRPRLGELHAGPFPETVTRAVVLPLVRPSDRVARAFVVAGVNPRHALDEQYQAFFELVAQQVGKALFGVLARDEERANAMALARAAQDAERAAEAERQRLYELFMQAPMPVAIVRGRRSGHGARERRGIADVGQDARRARR